MKTRQHIDTHTIETFLADLQQAVNPETMPKVPETAAHAQHPAVETLEQYATGKLEDDEAHSLIAHLAQCPACNRNALYLMRMTYDDEAAFIDELAASIADWRQNVSAFSQGVAIWATELWRPKFAGTPVLAGDIPTQPRTFSGRDGEIEINCSWRDEYGASPACLQLSWLANLSVDRELWAMFFDPETKAFLAEIPLGEYLEGGKNLTSDDLGFNPSTDTWAVAVLVKERTS